MHFINASFAATSGRGTILYSGSSCLPHLTPHFSNSVFNSSISHQRGINNERGKVIYIHSFPSSHLFQDKKLRDVTHAIQTCKHQISDTLGKIADSTEADITRVHSYCHVLRVFEVEMLCVQRDWPGLRRAVDVRRIITLHN